MISRITIENFKRFPRLDLETRRLTVLTGSNGGGKTSVLHAVLLARYAFAHPGADSVPLNGPYELRLGEAEEVLHVGTNPEDGIVIDFREPGDVHHRVRFGIARDRSMALGIEERSKNGPLVLASREARCFGYLCAERLGPRDLHEIIDPNESTLDVGARGDRTAQVLAQAEGQPVSAALAHPDGKTLIPTLRAHAELWLSAIVRPIELRATWLAGTSAAVLRFKDPGFLGEWIRPANMGFGLTYALPIVVAALTRDEPALLLVENPEAHLHPAGQSAMGHFLARVAASGIQVIVETHSDHVVNGMRKAVGCDALLSNDDLILYYFGASVGSEPPSPPERMTVGATGELSRWPKGFFDQIEDDLGMLARARRKGA